MSADRRPHPQAWEVQKVYQPVRIRAVDASEGRADLEVENRRQFVDLSDLEARFTVSADGEPVATGPLPLPAVAPGARVRVRLEWREAQRIAGAERFLRLEIFSREANGPVPRGHRVAWDQIPLPPTAPARASPAAGGAAGSPEKGAVTLRETPADIALSADGVTARIDRASGLLVSFGRAGRELLDAPPAPSFWRAPTDNDYGNGQQQRSRVWLDASRTRTLLEVRVTDREPHRVRVASGFALPSVAARYTLAYTLTAGGALLVEGALDEVDEDLPELPRFGLTLRLPRRFDRAEWFGRGPHDNYVDRSTGAAVGRYRMDVGSMWHPYPRPQETGTRTDVRWTALTDDGGHGLMAIGLPLVQFSAYPFALDDFDGGLVKTTRKPGELTERAFVTLNLDADQMGLGGDNSWGATARPEYLLTARPRRVRLLLYPTGGDGEDAARLARRVLGSAGLGGMVAERHATPARRTPDLTAHLARARPVALPAPQTSEFSRGGDTALTDGIRGSIDYRGGDWQGYEGRDFEAVVDLGAPTDVSLVKVGFLQNVGAKVFLPATVTVALSVDGTTFEEAGVAGHDVPVDRPVAERRHFSVPVTGGRARFVRVHATSLGRCPPGHAREGEPAWLFVDEIIVR